MLKLRAIIVELLKKENLNRESINTRKSLWRKATKLARVHLASDW